MTTQAAAPIALRSTDRSTPTPLRRRTRLVAILGLLVLLVLIWEGAKWIGGDPWRLHGTVAGIRIDYEHFPPLKWRIATDLALPHVWEIAAAFVQPAQRNGPPLGQVLLGKAVFTFGEALVGFAIGATLGLVLGIALRPIEDWRSERSSRTWSRRRPCRSSRSRRWS